MLGKILGAILVSKNLPNTTVILHRLLMDIATIIGLAIICAMLIGSFVIAALFGLYNVLIAHGLEPYASLWVVGLLVIVIIIVLLVILSNSVKKLKMLSGAAITNGPFVTKTNSIIQSFLDGFLSNP